MSTGAALVYRSPAPACVRETTMEPMAAAQAVSSMITLTAWRTRGCARLRRANRCCQAAATPGPALAMASIAIGGHQAAGPAGAESGIRNTAAVQASAAAGTQVT